MSMLIRMIDINIVSYKDWKKKETKCNDLKHNWMANKNLGMHHFQIYVKQTIQASCLICQQKWFRTLK